MKRKIEYYRGYEITEEVMNKINLIALKRIKEDSYSPLYNDRYATLEELCYWNEVLPEQINIILGEDWFIRFTETNKSIEINEWIDVDKVPNKLEQTAEMVAALKKILLSSQNKKLIASLKHNTSYKFYLSLLKRGLIHEFDDSIRIEREIPEEIKKVTNELESKYSFIEDFLKDPNRNEEQEVILEDYIYHDVEFEITDEFNNRYRK